MTLKQDLLPKDKPCRPGIVMKYIKSITIHWTGSYPNQSPKIVRDWFVQSNKEISAHYIIKDSECLQCLPDNEVAWHCGSQGNYSSIGIEVIPASVKGEFSDESIDTLKSLLLTLPYTYKVNDDLIKDVVLYRHWDWTGKDCPRYYTKFTKNGDSNWLKLKEAIR